MDTHDNQVYNTSRAVLSQISGRPSLLFRNIITSDFEENPMYNELFEFNNRCYSAVAQLK